MSVCKYCGKEVKPGQKYDSDLCKNLYWLRYKERDLAIPGKRPTAMGAWEYIRESALRFANGRCECCGKNHEELAEDYLEHARLSGEWVSPNLMNQINFFEVHHIVPVHLGGNSSLDNLIVLCKTCHLKAHEQIRIEEKLKKRNQKTIDCFFDSIKA